MAGSAGMPEWEKILRHSAYVRANPLFDAEARAKNLLLAEEVRAFLESTRQAGSPDRALDRLFQRLPSLCAARGFIHPKQERWMRRWFVRSNEPFGRALAAFLDSGADAGARFDSFASSLEEIREIEAWKRALWLGSLLNFAVDPQSLPIVDECLRSLEQVAGFDASPDSDPLSEQYRSHLLFARELERVLRERGTAIRDMLDVQSLVFLSSTFLSPRSAEVLWKSDPPDRALHKPADDVDHRRHPGEGSYLSVCSCLGYDAPYLVEWLEFHRLVGVERFFLYNNGDREAQRQLLEPYVEEGLVVLQDWPVFPPQVPAHNHCLTEHREESRWIAFIDTDEFLFGPTGRPLPEVLVGYEGWPGVGVNLVFFGSSGHRTKPPGLVTESYVKRWIPVSRLIKSIVDPRRVAECRGPHSLVCDDHVVDENHYPMAKGSPRTSLSSVSRLRINHYYTRSQAEFREKLSRPRPDNASPYQEEYFKRVLVANDETAEPDDAILKYLPQLRAAVRRRARAERPLSSKM